MHEDITAHVAYDKGVVEGLSRGKRECDRIVMIKEDLAYEKGFDAGKKFTRAKMIQLIDEVIDTYSDMAQNDVDPEIQAQIAASKFIKHWVMSGGHEDHEGNRVCLPW